MASWAQYRPDDLPTTMGRTAISSGIGRTASRTRLAERLVRATAPGDDSQPGPSPIAVGLTQHPDEHGAENPVLLAVDQELGEGPRLSGSPRTRRSGQLS